MLDPFETALTTVVALGSECPPPSSDVSPTIDVDDGDGADGDAPHPSSALAPDPTAVGPVRWRGAGLTFNGCTGYREKGGRAYDPHGWLKSKDGLCPVCRDLMQRSADDLAAFIETCVSLGITDSETIRVKWNAAQHAKPESRRLIAWSATAWHGRHDEVVAAFRARTKPIASEPPTLNLPPRPAHLDRDLALTNAHLDRIVKLRENREAIARGEPKPHKIKRIKREAIAVSPSSSDPMEGWHEAPA